MSTLTIDAHLHADDLARSLRDDVVRGLSSHPKELPPKWFYDGRGSDLFDQITRLPEYYPTRREREILERQASAIAQRTRADTLIELGSGTSEKTRILLHALAAAGTLRRFVPFDVSEPPLREASAAIAAEHPYIDVHAVVGDFDRHLHVLPTNGRRLVAFLGGTIGNMTPAKRAAFLRTLRATMQPGDSLLLGTDLVKSPRRLVPAYDDAAGVTAEFNRNVLHVINRELGATFVPEQFAHVAVWDADHEWIEMRLRSRRRHTVDVPGLGLTLRFEAGEDLRTEISSKFRIERIGCELAAAGLRVVDMWTDPAGDFALTMAVW